MKEDITRFNKIRYKWVILFACIMHFIWGILSIYSPSALFTTPTYVFALVYANNIIAGVFFILVAFFGLLGCFEKKNRIIQLFFLIPQQSALMVSAFGALFMIINGHYADGTERDIAFMLSDQIPIIIIAFMHFIVLIDHYWKWIVRKELKELNGIA